MPLFVFISGYLMTLSLGRRSVREVFKARCQTLLVPFLSWTILGVITTQALKMIDGKKVSIADVPWDFVNDLILHPSIWFLFTLFVSVCLLLSSITLEKRVGLIAFVLVFVPVALIPFNDYCSLFYIKWFYVFYAAGYFWSRLGIQITKPLIKNAMMVMILILFALLASLWDKGDYIYINKMNFLSGNDLYEFLRIGYRYLVGFLGIGVAFIIAAYVSNTRLQRVFETIGVFSLDIYLIQRYVVEGLYPRFVAPLRLSFDFNSPFFFFVFVPLMTVLFTGVCIGASAMVIRKTPLLNRLLLGGR
jgi:fucose 4-O-acetylase-like acetyltransferase